MALTTIDDRGLKTPIDLLDSEKIRFGTGNDLELYSDGTDSYITSATGELRVYSNGGILRMRAKANENAILAVPDAQVQLYYNNSKKLETANGGISVTGDVTATGVIIGTNFQPTGYLKLEDSQIIYIGTGNDLQISHNGADSTILNQTGNLRVRNTGEFQVTKSSTENMLIAVPDGQVELYHDNVKTFSTHSNGVSILGPEGGDSVIYLYADEGDDSADKWRFLSSGSASQLYIQNYASGGWETTIQADGNGKIELYYDDSKKFETTSDGTKVTGNLTVTTGNSILTNSSQGQLTIKGGATYPGGAIKFAGGQSGATDQGTIIFYAGTDTSLETRFRIQADGRVQIPNDTGKYECGSSGDLQIYHDGSNSYVKNTTGDFRFDASGPLMLRSDDIRGYNAAGDELIFRGQANAGVDLYHNNSKVFETLGNGVRAQGGIMFGSDSADANRITDYEQGDFTAKIGGQTNKDTYHQTGNGEYTKIGRLVYVHGYFAGIDIDNSASGQVIIYNLPFAPSFRSYGGAATANVHVSNVDFDPGKKQAWIISSSGLSGYQSADNGAHSDWSVTNFTNSSTFIWFSATYIV